MEAEGRKKEDGVLLEEVVEGGRDQLDGLGSEDGGQEEVEEKS